MQSEWQTLSLREAGVALIDCDHRTPPAVLNGAPYVAIPQMKEGRIEFADARLISTEHLTEWTRKAKPQAHDVILSRRCNPGATAFVRGDVEFALGQNLVLLRSDGRKVRSEFLRWLVRGPEWWNQVQKFINVGAVFESLKCADVPKFELLIPHMEEQKRIAHILGTLDDKIELNRRMNATMEAMARALFQSWFVDFDAVRAKAAGQTPAGMDSATADLFPSEFENSELGEIPKGWAVKPASEVLDINPARRLKAGTVAPYIDMKNMPTDGHAVEEVIQREAGSGAKFINGDTLLARITPCLENGKTAFVDCLPDDDTVAWGSTEYIVLRANLPLPPEYAYYLARSDDFRGHAIQSMTGTSGRQRVPTTCFEHFQFAVPPASIVCVLGEMVRIFMNRIRSNVAESRTLSALRDALLPKLLSGELTTTEHTVESSPCSEVIETV